MALTPRLDLRQSQTLVMTPQLQQAIKLLQLSNLELSEYVEEELEKNPMLERDEGHGDDGDDGDERGDLGLESNSPMEDSGTEGSDSADIEPESLQSIDFDGTQGVELADDARHVDYYNAYSDDGGERHAQTPACPDAGRAGAEKVFLRVASGSDVLKTACRSGFSPYLTERLMAAASLRNGASNGSAPKQAQPSGGGPRRWSRAGAHPRRRAAPAPQGERAVLPAQVGLWPPSGVDGGVGNDCGEVRAELPPGVWTGPVGSAYGVHLVRILDSVPARTPPLEEVRDAVLRDWKAAKAQEIREQDYAEQRKGFVVEIRRGDARAAESQ